MTELYIAEDGIIFNNKSDCMIYESRNEFDKSGGKLVLLNNDLKVISINDLISNKVDCDKIAYFKGNEQGIEWLYDRYGIGNKYDGEGAYYRNEEDYYYYKLDSEIDYLRERLKRLEKAEDIMEELI